MERQLEGAVEANELSHTVGQKWKAQQGGKKYLGRRPRSRRKKREPGRRHCACRVPSPGQRVRRHGRRASTYGTALCCAAVSRCTTALVVPSCVAACARGLQLSHCSRRWKRPFDFPILFPLRAMVLASSPQLSYSPWHIWKAQTAFPLAWMESRSWTHHHRPCRSRRLCDAIRTSGCWWK